MANCGKLHDSLYQLVKKNAWISPDSNLLYFWDVTGGKASDPSGVVDDLLCFVDGQTDKMVPYNQVFYLLPAGSDPSCWWDPQTRSCCCHACIDCTAASQGSSLCRMSALNIVGESQHWRPTREHLTPDIYIDGTITKTSKIVLERLLCTAGLQVGKSEHTVRPMAKNHIMDDGTIYANLAGGMCETMKMKVNTP